MGKSAPVPESTPSPESSDTESDEAILENPKITREKKPYVMTEARLKNMEKSKKRDRSQAKLEEEAEMVSIREQMNVDIVTAREEEASRQQEREEAVRMRETIENMAADMAQFKDDMRAIMRKISE
jgi:hypothetical protein